MNNLDNIGSFIIKYKICVKLDDTTSHVFLYQGTHHPQEAKYDLEHVI